MENSVGDRMKKADRYGLLFNFSVRWRPVPRSRAVTCRCARLRHGNQNEASLPRSFFLDLSLI